MNRIDELEASLATLKEEFDISLEAFCKEANEIIIKWINEENIPDDLRFAVLMYYNHWLDDMMLNLSYYAITQEDFQSSTQTVDIGVNE